MPKERSNHFEVIGFTTRFHDSVKLRKVFFKGRSTPSLTKVNPRPLATEVKNFVFDKSSMAVEWHARNVQTY